MVVFQGLVVGNRYILYTFKFKCVLIAICHLTVAQHQDRRGTEAYPHNNAKLIKVKSEIISKTPVDGSLSAEQALYIIMICITSEMWLLSFIATVSLMVRETVLLTYIGFIQTLYITKSCIIETSLLCMYVHFTILIAVLPICYCPAKIPNLLTIPT